MATKSEVVAEARTWIGTRFHHQARIKGRGVDCINMVIAVATEVGLLAPDDRVFDWENYPEYHGYGTSPNGSLLLSGCDRFMDRISIKDLQPADVIIFRFVQEAQHFAIVTSLEPTYIVHAYAQVKRVVEHRFDEVWLARAVGAYRFRGLTG